MPVLDAPAWEVGPPVAEQEGGRVPVPWPPEVLRSRVPTKVSTGLCTGVQTRARREAVDMSDAGSDPINFTEIDARGNPARYGREHADGGSGTYGPVRRQWGTTEGGAAGQGRLSINPFIVALWAVAAGLIMAAFAAFTIAQELLSVPGSPESTPVGYMWMTFAPFLLFAGLLGVMGLLFWHASQWRRNRDMQPPPS